jgi:hypothetical protein
MTEQRCPHGFLRSQVGCQECGPVSRPNRKPCAPRPAPPIQVKTFPMSCRFCRRGCHHENHCNTCHAWRRYLRRARRLEGGLQRRRDREAFAA